MAFVTWFSVAAANDPNGEVTIASTNSEDPMLYGNLMALGCGGVIALGGSLAFPDTEFRWEMLGRIPMIDDVMPEPAEGEDEASLLVESGRAKKQAGLLSLLLVVAWPIPMYLSGAVMGSTGFALWIGLAILWALAAACVIVLLPPLEVLWTRSPSDASPAPQATVENPAAGSQQMQPAAGGSGPGGGKAPEQAPQEAAL